MSEETIPQMREALDNANKSIKDLTATNEKLTTDNRGFAARDAFRNEGYAANHGDLYAASNPEGEITVDAVNEFAGQFNLTKVETAVVEDVTEDADGGAGDGTDASAPGSTDLGKMDRGGSSSSDGTGGVAPEKMTIPEWQALMQSDPVAGEEAQRQGRVAVSGDNPWVDGKPVAPGLNPYAPKPE